MYINSLFCAVSLFPISTINCNFLTTSYNYCLCFFLTREQKIRTRLVTKVQGICRYATVREDVGGGGWHHVVYKVCV